MQIDTPEMDEADTLADLWVALARGQYEHGSYLAAEDNRTPIYESICQHIITGDIFVARLSDCDADSKNDSGASADRCGDIVGFVMFTSKTDRYEEVVSTGVVENLYVVPDLREKGIGSELLAAAEDALQADGTEVVTLDVMEANDAARRFYARHGYSAHRIKMAKNEHGREHETDTHSKDEG